MNNIAYLNKCVWNKFRKLENNITKTLLIAFWIIRIAHTSSNIPCSFNTNFDLKLLSSFGTCIKNKNNQF